MLKNIKNMHSHGLAKYFSPTTLFIALLMMVMLSIRILPFYAVVFPKWPHFFGPGYFVNFSDWSVFANLRQVYCALDQLTQWLSLKTLFNDSLNSVIGFASPWSFLVATTAMLLGLGHPTLSLVDHSAAYLSPLFAALTLLPTYLIAKKLFGKTAALITLVFLTFLPGLFLSKSILGYASQDALQVLLFTTTLFLFLQALELLSNGGEKKSSKKNLCWYAFWAGLSLGVAFFNSALILFFGSIFFLFFLASFAFLYGQKKSLVKLVGVILAFYGPIFVLNLFSKVDYLVTAYLILIMLVSLGAAYFSTMVFTAQRLARFWYLLFLLVLISVIGIVIYIAIPLVKEVIANAVKYLSDPWRQLLVPDQGLLGIMQSGASDAFKLTWQLWFDYFGVTIFFSIIGLGLIGGSLYCQYKKIDLQKFFFFLVSVVLLVATLLQRRFALYFAINVVMLSGYAFSLVWTYGIAFCLKKIGNEYGIELSFKFLFAALLVLLSCSSICSKVDYGEGLIVGLKNLYVSQYYYGLTRTWYEALFWLKGYVAKAPNSSLVNTGDVMSWRDYRGATNFLVHSQNFVANNDMLLFAKFLSSFDEHSGLANLNSRYVLIDNALVCDNFFDMQALLPDHVGWKKNLSVPIYLAVRETLPFSVETAKFYNSLLAKLYYYDADNFSHLRLIYESSGNYRVDANVVYLSASAGWNMVIDRSAPFFSSDYNKAQQVYNQGKEFVWLNTNKTMLGYGFRPPAKTIKIFEKVPGATIVGSAPTGTLVNLSLDLKINKDRILHYQQKTRSIAGIYKFIVPYATMSIYGDGIVVVPIANYKIVAGKKVLHVSITEKAVMDGETIIF
jgi:asparagine N-glycosylation enzyme membrane subunit Stt3